MSDTRTRLAWLKRSANGTATKPPTNEIAPVTITRPDSGTAMRLPINEMGDTVPKYHAESGAVTRQQAVDIAMSSATWPPAALSARIQPDSC